MVVRGRIPWALGLAALCGAGWAGAVAAEALPETLRFNRHIRPILSDKCYACHGPDANTRNAGLRLDVPPAESEAGVIVPGNPGASELVRRILAEDPADRMPPPEAEKQLTDREKALLRTWVAEGATYEPHWAYIPPRVDETTQPPDFQARTNPIDAFVDRRLAEEGLPVAPPADPVTLVRRLHWDLLGLPPTPAVVRGFAESDDPGAYEALVDSLLDSPHYGERMAIDWLDAVRYADTNGYHSDEFRSIYPYRDYVIRAFNENMPFDQFTREQLAGDLLPNPTQDQLVASGYNRLNQLTAEGGAQAKEYLAKYAADRVRTTGTVWMGTTMGCAECHDHKFDPISARDFYSFAAFFADIEEKGVYRSGDIWAPRMYVPTEEQAEREAALTSAITGLEEHVTTYTPALEAARDAWTASVQTRRSGAYTPWRHPAPIRATAADERTTLSVQDDQRVLAGGPEPPRDTFTLEFAATGEPVAALRLEALNAAAIGGLSRGGGNFVLTALEVSYRATEDDEAVAVDIASAAADYAQEGFPVANVLDGDRKTGWATDAHREPVDRVAVFRLAEVLETDARGTIEVRLHFESDHEKHQLDSFRIGFTADAVAARSSWRVLPAPVREALAADPAARTAAQDEAIGAHYLAHTPKLDGARRELAVRQSDRAALRDQMATTLVAKARAEPREIRVLPRGNWLDDSGPVVAPDTPEVLPDLGVEGRRANRLDLANWLVREDNPLTARVTMNRLWDRFYGNGISKVLDDLGAQGEWPTHPDLLDWLAAEFVDSGWDVKHMVRLMVTSEAYKRSSQAPPGARARDPYNRLLARQSRYRLEAELVRDGALAVSGLLTRSLGGRPVYPYQPDGYYASCNVFGGELKYDTETDENQYRRGMYTFWKRSFLHPSMLAFDAPTREECTAERTVSNTPLQALVLLNDPSYVEAARVFAQRIMENGGTRSDERIAAAFAYALSRQPTEDETAMLRALYQEHRADYTRDPAAAEALLNTGIAPVPADVDPAELAAWTSVARVILNLHETITRS